MSNKEELIETLQSQLKTFRDTLGVEELQKGLEEQGLMLAKMKSNTGTSPANALETQIKSVVKDNAEGFKAAARQKGTTVEFAVKADTLNSSVTNNTNAYRVNDIGGLQYRQLKIADVFQKVTVSKGMGKQVSYIDWDKDTTILAATTIAEGSLFPESTAKFAQYDIPLKKIGVTVPASEEILHDESYMTTELTNFVREDVSLEEDTQLYSGDSTGENLTGLHTTAPTYTAVASGIANPLLPDLLVKMVENIMTNTKFMPDVVFLSPVDYNGIILSKNSDNNYINVPFMQGNKILSLEVVLSNVVTANTCIVGQKSKAKIYQDGEVVVSAGYGNDDYLRDMVSLKGRKRELLLIRNCEVQAWRKSTDIAADIATIGTAPA